LEKNETDNSVAIRDYYLKELVVLLQKRTIFHTLFPEFLIEQVEQTRHFPKEDWRCFDWLK
jgi:hypothetical protein